LERIKS